MKPEIQALIDKANALVTAHEELYVEWRRAGTAWYASRTTASTIINLEDPLYKAFASAADRMMKARLAHENALDEVFTAWAQEVGLHPLREPEPFRPLS